MLDKELQNQIIAKNREFTKGYRNNDPYMEDFESDQDLKLPQPPLVKAAVTPAESHIPLTRDFSGLRLKNDLLSLIRDRRSARIYTQETRLWTSCPSCCGPPRASRVSAASPTPRCAPFPAAAHVMSSRPI